MAGRRWSYADLPVGVRNAVDRVLGSPVVAATSQPGGFSHGSADRVMTAIGRRAFVKATGTALDASSATLHRREAVAVAALDADVPAPALLGVHDDGDWVALVLEDVPGRHPDEPWGADDLDAVLAATRRVAAAPAPAGLPDLATDVADDLAGWHRLDGAAPVAPDGRPLLDDWALAHRDELAEVAERAPATLAGEALVHADLRADNALLRADGSAVLVDWAWACRGAAWFDVVTLLLDVLVGAGAGAPAVDVDALLLEHAPEAPPDDVTALVVALAGCFADKARRPAPPPLAALRSVQAAEARAALSWARRRLQA